MLVHRDSYLGEKDESVSSRDYSSFFARARDGVFGRARKLIDRVIFGVPKCQIAYRAEYEILDVKDLGDYFCIHLHLGKAGSFFEPPPEDLETQVLKSKAIGISPAEKVCVIRCVGDCGVDSDGLLILSGLRRIK